MAFPAAAQTPLGELLARAAAMTAQGQHAEAYALLAAEEDAHIGEIAFDYALGRAALHAGRPDRATLAFARVLALDPMHAGARIDSGRAFLALGNHEQARSVFEELLALDPPSPLRTQLLVYLAQARRIERGRLALRGYLSASGGASSNVNQAPGQGQIFVPGLLATFQLADQNVGKDDSFGALAGGIEATLPLDAVTALIAGADFLERRNADESAFDVGGVSANVGLAWSLERQLLRAQVHASRTTLGGRNSRELAAVSIEAIETAAKRSALYSFAQVGAFRHLQPDLRVFDADFIGGGLGGLFRIDGNSTVTVGLLAAKEGDRGGNPSGDRRALGVRLAGETALAARWRLGGQVVLQRSDFNRFDPAFLVERLDKTGDFEAFVRYEIDPKLHARLGVLRSVQDSNIPIHEFRRTDVWLMLRRDFW